MPVRSSNRLINAGRRVAAATLALTIGLGMSGTPAGGRAEAEARTTSSPVLPPECATKTVLSPLLAPSWAFVMNFDVIGTRADGTQYPVGCLIAWRRPFVATDYITIESCQAFGAVSFGGGQALFNGGHVRCTVNVKAALAALSPPLVIGAEEPYPPFEIIGAGLIFPPTTPHPYGNPVAYYQPNAAGAKPAGLFIPAVNVNGMYTIKSYFNGIDNVDDNVRFLSSQTPQTWTAKHQPLPEGYRVQHALDWSVINIFFPRPLVSLRTDGATIYVGGSPLGPSFDGILDEAIVDPPDRSGPTAFTNYTTYAPIAVR
ncbi:MAG: hypothetical protein RMN52_08890 [Anaerolineae bacterium]|nr:hypothetical protein [Candidatus Roseilinea sp.]MDW8450107.1 hypothetical protein [Anaerolineae bacterium]